MKTRFAWTKILCSFAVAFAAATAEATPATVTATLDPVSIALGESAQLSITINGSDTAEPVMPTVRGLEITPGGQSSTFQSINGVVTSSVSLLYQVTPDRAGTFTIPPVHLPGGESTQPLVLRVLQKADNSANSALPPPDVQSGANNGAENAKAESAFLRVVLPKQELYVGELVPVQVKAYFRAGMAASLNGLPALSSDAFTLNKLDSKPDRSQEMIGGHPYIVLTWSSTLSAVKAGDYAVNLELPVIVRVQERRRRGNNPFKQFFGNSRFPNSAFDNSFFDDSAFDDFFGGVTEKPLTLRADLENVKVMSLPTAGRPADFTGAVGKFEVTGEAAPAQLTAGDPVTLRLKVSGQGNFDRVTSQGLPASRDWKTYPPSARFEPADSAGYTGTKTFEQAVVPLKAGAESIPALTFSYFDPDTRRYMTRTTTPIAIQVSPGGSVPVATTSPISPATASQKPVVNPAATDIFPNKIEAGNFVSSLRPVLFAPWFIAAQGVPITALVAGLLFCRRRERLARDQRWAGARAAEAAVREQLVAMEQALAGNSAPAFFTAARQAVQERLAQCWQVSPSQVTPAEIDRRLNGDGKDARALFAVADAVVYSGQHVTPADLKHWRDLVVRRLRKLEKS